MKTFLIQPALSPQRALARLEQTFELEEREAGVSRQRRYYDTFDHRLYRGGLTLFQEEGRLRLGGGSSEPESSPAGARFMAADLGPGELKATVEPITGLRALLEQARVEEHQARWALLNRDQKTVAWVTYRAGEALAEGERYSLAPTLSISPLRGYSAQAKIAADLLSGVLTPAPEVGHPLQAALAALGRAPLDYDAKAAPSIDPGERTDQAFAKLLRAQLKICAANVSGTVEDIDIEFLHDLRVALRKARSLLKDARQTFPADVLGEAQAALRVVAHGTNQLRDLDVFLIARERYAALLPNELQAGVGPLYDDLARRRGEAQRGVAKLLQGPAFARALKETERLCSRAGRGPSDSIGAHARQTVAKRYRRVCKEAAKITQESPDEALHELRIHCKRLRYGLELYGGALQDTKQAVRQLKSLQGVLGDFNDLSVQRERLHGCLSLAETASDPRVCAAVGGLVAALAAEQSRVRADYWGAYEAFSRRRVQRLFATLSAESAPNRKRRRAA